MAFRNSSRRWSSVDVNTERKCESFRRSSDSAVKRLPAQFANIDWNNDDSETGSDDEKQEDSDRSSLSEESIRADSDSDSSSSLIAGNESENAKAQELKVRNDSKSRSGSKEPITRTKRMSSLQVVPAGLVRFRRGVRKTMMTMRFKRKESGAHGVCVKDVSTRAKQRYSVLFRTITDQRELEFLQELLRSLPILLNETSWLVEMFKACNDFEGRAPIRHVCDLITKSMHWQKILTARYCWAHDVEPKREELTKLSEKYEDLKRQFNTARSNYLLEVSALRNKMQTRADVTEVLGKSDGKCNVEMFCPITVLHEEERTFFMKAVEEKLKMLVDVDKNGNLAANMSQINAFNEAQREDDLRELNQEIEENRQKVAKLEKRCYTLEKEAEVTKLKSVASSSAADDKNVKLLEMHVAKLKQQLKETTLEGENALAVAQADIAVKIATIEVMEDEIAELKKAEENQNAAEAAEPVNVGMAIVISDVDAEEAAEPVNVGMAIVISDVDAEVTFEEVSATEPKEEELEETCDNVVNASSQDIWDFVDTSLEEGDIENFDFGIGVATKSWLADPEEAFQPQPVSRNKTDSKRKTDPICFRPVFKLSEEHAEAVNHTPLSIITASQPPQKDAVEISDVIETDGSALLPESLGSGPPLPAGTKQSMPSLRRGHRRVPPRSVTEPNGSMSDFLAPILKSALNPASTTTVDPENAFCEKFQNGSFRRSSISNSVNSNKGSLRKVSSSRFGSSGSRRGFDSIVIPSQRRRPAPPDEEALNLSSPSDSSRRQIQNLDPEIDEREFNLSRNGKFRRFVPAADQRSLSDTNLGSMINSIGIAWTKEKNEEMKVPPLPPLREKD